MKLIQSKSLKNSSLSHCGTLVREHDPDRFMISMFLESDMREDVWTLLAFNFEIARIRETVSDGLVGMVRLHWWRSEIDRIYLDEDVSDHEILTPLAYVIRKYDLDQSDFEALLDTRAVDLEDDVQPENLEGLMNYAEFTTRPLYELILRVCGDDPELEILQPTAINYALMGVLRVSVKWVEQGRCLLPVDLMKKHDLDQNNLLSDKKHESLQALVQEIIEEGCLTPVGNDQVFLRGIEALSAMYKKQISNVKYDITSPKLLREPMFKALRLYLEMRFSK